MNVGDRSPRGSMARLSLYTAHRDKILASRAIAHFGAGSRYFCESLFWASQPKQAAKT
ncbi:hypothetical protein [Bathymodiolus platifrons methanotrophic gill symbiont]|uniref:hypothetical protein n=1 Tax=Bathymodiolus platifrons methanotrophic gill symbiont TaxID=113268 RepID=UPI001C8D5EEB|nr:hypothetical protein [Bathymodiolus platifrons methanotrophic gill symbiont]